MSPKVFRRKLQKKLKKKKRGTCLACQGRTVARILSVSRDSVCTYHLVRKCWDCKGEVELFWTGKQESKRE